MKMTQRAEQLLESLDADQREVALQVTGPLAVHAGAGTGKTRAITYRIAYAVASGAYGVHDVLAVTFTARAAAQMRDRLRQLGIGGVQARTFHSAALRQLSYFWSSAIGGEPRNLIEHKAPLVAAAAISMGVESDKTLVRDIAAEIEWAKVSLITTDDYEEVVERANRPMPGNLSASELSLIMRNYESAKNDRGVIDFEDVLLLMIGILESRPDIAQQIRRQYQHFVVDEYQDVSPLQQRLLDLWLGDRKNLCVVGDAAQTIYSFAGASSSYLGEFKNRFPAARVIKLNRDYRSTPQIVGLANQIVEQMADTSTVKLIAQRPDGADVVFDTYDDDAGEARGVAQHILKLLKNGIKLSEIAILYRTNVQAQEFVSAFDSLGIGYQLRGGEAFFNRADVRKTIVLLRSLARSDPAMDTTEAVRSVVSSLGWTAVAPIGRGAVRERWDALNALVELVDDSLSLPAFVSYLEERAEAQHAPTVEGVTLSTIHAAKGLEWKAVFLIGVSEGLLPISQVRTEGDIEEERRLLYVAVTRAQEYLCISWARARTDRKASRRVSRFLQKSWPKKVVNQAVPLPPPAQSRTQSSRALTREFLATADAVVVDRFESLRQWRAGVAKGLGRGAFQVLTDLSLRDIAERAPGQIKELLEVRGMGMVKLEQFGRFIMRILDGEDIDIIVRENLQALAEFDPASIAD